MVGGILMILKNLRIFQKNLKSGAHQEENIDEYTNIENITNRIRKRKIY